LAVNSCLNLFSWSLVKAVLGLLSSEDDEDDEVVVVFDPPSDFFIFLARGPELGLSE